MIAAKKAIVLWNLVGEKITDLRVVDIAEQDASTAKLSMSSGACNRDWLNGDVWDTPMGVWLFLVTKWGFASEDLMLAALWEFNQIEGEVWVETLLRRLGVDIEEPDE